MEQETTYQLNIGPIFILVFIIGAFYSCNRIDYHGEIQNLKGRVSKLENKG